MKKIITFTSLLFLVILTFGDYLTTASYNNVFRTDGIWMYYNNNYNDWVIFINNHTAWVNDPSVGCGRFTEAYQIVEYRIDPTNTILVADILINPDTVPKTPEIYVPYVLINVFNGSNYLSSVQRIGKRNCYPTTPIIIGSYLTISYTPTPETTILKILDDSHVLIIVAKTTGTTLQLQYSGSGCGGSIMSSKDFTSTLGRYYMTYPDIANGTSPDGLYHILVYKDGDNLWKEFISFGETMLEIIPRRNSTNHMSNFKIYRLIV